ncbi:MAG: tRNA 2-thiouridine(34) synthase MnmA [Evtepia sp.]|uniref:tRNA 2-thiouridine(34) synthase MnmA n=1 Tax=Evtepia sp. TaxID=2773933 RepID=UPI002A757B0F|nr:tRNA 2-thiouridine(34) synthase MnmA [Evtepia sp.]MDY3014912.1 tRNA 2-thiouridine(34) synthase MnmA [Evtepia sp.]
MNRRVVLGLSGGVDSAVAACLLKEQGYEVLGHWLDIGLDGREDAQAVAQRLDIPFSAGDIRQELEEQVMGPFRQDYLAGRTPLPCARCNPTVKFPALFREAERVGADYVATGHYARILRDEEGGAALCRGLHRNDQAFLLARLPQAWLDRILFPIGVYEKPQVRELARGYGIPVAEKPDSMEICFIPDGDYAAWMDRQGLTPPPGPFVDREGNRLGTHKGIHHYTIGQRRGLGIPAEHRLFVSEIRPQDNTVVLSDGTDLMADQVWGEDVNLLADISQGQELTVRLRHSKTETPARFYREGSEVRLELLAPARAPTPGQMAVFYQGDRVLGSAWITRARRLR